MFKSVFEVCLLYLSSGEQPARNGRLSGLRFRFFVARKELRKRNRRSLAPGDQRANGRACRVLSPPTSASTSAKSSIASVTSLNEREKWRELQFESAIEVQKLFVKLVKNYFDGQTPLKAVEYYENVTRDHLDYLCDSFSEFLIVTEATDPVTSKMATLYNP